jgi:hypothetical protein
MVHSQEYIECSLNIVSSGSIDPRQVAPETLLYHALHSGTGFQDRRRHPSSLGRSSCVVDKIDLRHRSLFRLFAAASFPVLNKRDLPAWQVSTLQLVHPFPPDIDRMLGGREVNSPQPEVRARVKRPICIYRLVRPKALHGDWYAAGMHQLVWGDHYFNWIASLAWWSFSDR